MKIKKGLPPGYMQVKEDLRNLVEKLHQLSPGDRAELEAFLEFLQKGPERINDDSHKEQSDKIYEFMDGGLDKTENLQNEPRTDPAD